MNIVFAHSRAYYYPIQKLILLMNRYNIFFSKSLALNFYLPKSFGYYEIPIVSLYELSLGFICDYIELCIQLSPSFFFRDIHLLRNFQNFVLSMAVILWLQCSNSFIRTEISMALG